MTQEQKDVCRKALLTYGKESQINMCIEECAELIDALCKHMRERNDFRDVCTEIADVMICVAQMAMVFGEKEVEKQIEYKIERLKERLEQWQ